MIRSESGISEPPFDSEFYRRAPYLFLHERVPQSWGVDNSGVAVPTDGNQFPPFLRLNTGANGANKTQEYGTSLVAVGDASPGNDGFAIHGDPSNTGFWRRTHIVDCLVRCQAVAGSVIGGKVGIEIGTYGVVPPDPATSPNNVVRVFMDATSVAGGSGAWYVQTCPGDNATAPVTSAYNAAVANSKLQRIYRVRLVHKAGQYVAGYVDGKLIARLTTGLPIATPANSTAFVGWYVTSGSAAGNVRGVFSNCRAQVLW